MQYEETTPYILLKNRKRLNRAISQSSIICLWEYNNKQNPVQKRRQKDTRNATVNVIRVSL